MANPLLQMLGLKANNPSFMDIIGGIKNGTVDPKAEVERRLSQLSPADRSKLKMAMPMMQAFAKRYGVSEDTLNQVASVLQVHM